MSANQCTNTDQAAQDAAIQEKLASIDNIIIVLSGKGGVGKSTTAVNLTLSLASQGCKTGILDVDIHGPSVPKLLGLTGRRIESDGKQLKPIECFTNVSAVSMGLLLDSSEQAIIWRGPMKANVIKEFIEHVAWGKLDYLVIDCPPGTGDEPLSVAQMVNNRARAVIVTTPQEVAVIDVEKCVTFCEQVNLPIAGIVENMSGFICPHCKEETHIFSHGGGEKLAAKFGVPFLGKVPLDPDIVTSGDEGKPYMWFYGKSETAKRFTEIVDKIIAGQENSCGHSGTCGTPEKTNTLENKITIPEGHMKFAVPTHGGVLCAHFGHCEAFALVDVDENKTITNETYVTPPPHEPGLLPPWLAQQGVNCVIAGGMGARAQQIFAENGVTVVTGAQGQYPKEIVGNYLKGALVTGANTCDH